MGSRGVFLDRDGIIIKAILRKGKPYPPASIQEFQYVEGIHAVLTELRQKGFELFIATNQPDVARGAMPMAIVESFHAKILSELPIRAVYTCYHDDQDACACRKPKAGLLYQARAEFDIDLDRSFMVGDRWRDIDCGNQARCTTIFVDYGYDESLKTQATFVVKQVSDILKHIR